MSRLPPLALEDLDAETSDLIANAETLMGFVPNDALVMARHPQLLKAMWGLVAAIYGPGEVENGLKRLIGEATSKADGCFYCSAHAAHGARAHGVSEAKIEAVWSFEESHLFSPAERSAIRVAMGAGRVPNEVSDEAMRDLRRHYSDRAIVEIVSVIAMFGFLNRWNNTLGTTLEPIPMQTVKEFDLK